MNREIQYMSVSTDEELITIECYDACDSPELNEPGKMVKIPLNQLGILTEWLHEALREYNGGAK